MNYTRPNDEDHEDSPKDWLSGALVFARALSLLIEPNTGMIVRSMGDMKDTFNDEELLLVCNNGRQIQILPTSDIEFEEELKEGDFIKITLDGKEDESE